MLFLPLALQATDTLNPTETRYRVCLDMATSNPEAAQNEAERFRLAGGGFKARQCLGLAYAMQEKWRDAAIAFEAAAQEATAAKDPLATRYWAQAGNAWLATGEPVKAYAALNTALADGSLTGQDKGEALLDRARSLVAAGQVAGARADLDAALEEAPKDPLAWLLSATLARRMKDLPRAQSDIAQALKLSADDASVQLEAGNIAAMAGDGDGAKKAWEAAVKIAPTSSAGQNARAALAQFDAPVAPPTPTPTPAPTPPAK